MNAPAAIVWFRRDLRLADNPSLAAAAAEGAPVVPVFVFSPEDDGEWAPGAASRWYLHGSLDRLAERLARHGLRLAVRRGPAAGQLAALARETGARIVHAMRLPEPAARAIERDVENALARDGVGIVWHATGLLHDPEELRNRTGGPYRVFTPFHRALAGRGEPEAPAPEPGPLRPPATWPDLPPLQKLELLPRIDWAAGIREAWQPGEDAAHRLLERFIDEAMTDYAEGRDRPDRTGTSRLSPALHFGELSARQIWETARQAAASDRRAGRGTEAFLRQLVWREFGHHILHHFPHTPREPLRDAFARFPWRWDGDALRAWQRGRTGYPIMDAGMRELWTTGWMHNRVRMIAASFLVKDLMVHWQEGARWFWDTLLDADLANNTLGWQWVAGCGADAAPFFRIFNPVVQGEKFDPRGDYVRRWLPALAGLPPRWIHRPWEAPESVLHAAGLRLGEHYPCPMVDHAETRVQALKAYEATKRKDR